MQKTIRLTTILVLFIVLCGCESMSRLDECKNLQYEASMGKFRSYHQPEPKYPNLPPAYQGKIKKYEETYQKLGCDKYL